MAVYHVCEVCAEKSLAIFRYDEAVQNPKGWTTINGMLLCSTCKSKYHHYMRNLILKQELPAK